MPIRKVLLLVFFISGCTSTSDKYAGWKKEMPDWSGTVSRTSHLDEKIVVAKEEPLQKDEDWIDSEPTQRNKTKKSLSTTKKKDSSVDVTKEW